MMPAPSAMRKNPESSQTYSRVVNKKVFPETFSNKGISQPVNPNATKKDRRDNRMASHKNWRIREVLSAPNTFLTPISTALFEERAVERFMKLTQAIRMVTRAM